MPVMVRRYPAILIGGPPHSGKSTLTYQLGAALRRQVKLYILRASPDGEGAWTFEVAPDIVHTLRRRARQGPGWTPEFANLVRRHVEQRHLPLLVDVGGVPSPEVEQILTECTGAILLADDLDKLRPWRALLARQDVPLLAELRSALDGVQALDDPGPPLHGVISGLIPGNTLQGPCFDRLVTELARLFWFEPSTLARANAGLTNIEPFLNLEAPLGALPAHSFPDTPWQPNEIPALLSSLSPAMPLAIYGVAPLWLYAALAAFANPAPCVLFNIALGWVAPPLLLLANVMDALRLHWDAVIEQPEYTHVKLSVPSYYLDYADADKLPLPRVPLDRGVVLDGKLPNWLYAGLARVYAPAAWVGVYEPRSQPAHAVVVCSRDAGRPVGSLVPL
jgi:CRISPR-associated protein Csx3